MILLNAVAVLAYLATLIYICKKYQEYFIIFAYLSVTQLWALVSCFYNDLGVYNLELFRYTETTLATARLGVFYIIFNLGFVLTARLVGKRVLTRRDYSIRDMNLRLGNLMLVGYVLIAAVVGYLGYSFWTSGIPLLKGPDRFTYFQESGILDRFLFNWGELIAFALGLFRRRTGRFTVNGLILLVFLVYVVLSGHKYSFPVILLVCYFTPVFIRRVYHDASFTIFRLRYLMTGLAIALVFMVFSFGTYLREMKTPDIALGYLVHRILACQGEIWWVIDHDNSTFGTYDPEHWQVELGYIVSPDHNSAEDVGMRHLMIKILGPEKAYMVFDRGYLYTMAYPAILIVTFPYAMALGLQFVAGAALFIFLYYLYYTIAYRHHFRALLSILVVLPFVTMLFTGNFFVFASLGMPVKIMVLVAMEIGLFKETQQEIV